MDANSQDTSRSTLQNKHQWIESEDRKLIEAILDLHNTEKYTMEGALNLIFLVLWRESYMSHCQILGSK